MDKNPRSGSTDKPVVTATSPGMARTIRETVESIVIAFVLAFLFRTFEAEAFVIPTGSMAPTLQGRHKDVDCPECGYPYKVGARGEAEERNPRLRMLSGVCPMCRYELSIEEGIEEEPREFQTFEGDRILVNKFSYDLAEPKRWDVVVFKYPEDAKTNYIKRLAGLPGERVYVGDPGRAFRVPAVGTGDIYISTDGGKTRQIARKESPDKLLAVLQDVYDNDYVPTSLLEANWSPRWQPAGPSQDGSWIAEDNARVFACEGRRDQTFWLRYRHLVPEDGSWIAAARADLVPDVIRDVYAYNTGDYQGHDGVDRNSLRGHWVGDLVLECEVAVGGDEGDLVLELVKGGRAFQARIDVKTGDARLVIPGLEDFKPVAKGILSGAGTYQLRFANVDEKLWLFVDGELVNFDTATTYDPLDNYAEVMNRESSQVGATDVSPVGIASTGVPLSVSHLRIKRDVFYTKGETNEIQLKDESDDELDQFFMLGDNSPASKDGRLWGPVDYVERRLLIGKAVYIYWPHGIPAGFSFPIRIFGADKYIPFWPNFARMRRVR